MIQVRWISVKKRYYLANLSVGLKRIPFNNDAKRIHFYLDSCDINSLD